jgi:hypothetical protein
MGRALLPGIIAQPDPEPDELHFAVMRPLGGGGDGGGDDAALSSIDKEDGLDMGLVDWGRDDGGEGAPSVREDEEKSDDVLPTNSDGDGGSEDSSGDDAPPVPMKEEGVLWDPLAEVETVAAAVAAASMAKA